MIQEAVQFIMVAVHRAHARISIIIPLDIIFIVKLALDQKNRQFSIIFAKMHILKQLEFSS